MCSTARTSSPPSTPPAQQAHGTGRSESTSQMALCEAEINGKGLCFVQRGLQLSYSCPSRVGARHGFLQGHNSHVCHPAPPSQSQSSVPPIYSVPLSCAATSQRGEVVREAPTDQSILSIKDQEAMVDGEEGERDTTASFFSGGSRTACRTSRLESAGGHHDD